MAEPNTPVPPIDPRLAALLRIAGDLHDLPSAEFKARLKAELVSKGERSGAPPVGGRPLLTEEDIDARLKEMADEPRFVAYDLQATLKDLPQMTMRFLTSLNECTLIVSRGDRPSHWERHPAADELLYVLDGEIDAIVLTDSGRAQTTVRAGSLFVCPQGLWHRLIPRPFVDAFYLTPGAGTEASDAEDPRRESAATPPARQDAGKLRRPVQPKLTTYDLRAAQRDLPYLAITTSTTGEEADAAVRNIMAFNQLTLGLMRFSGQTPWERHPGGDELLYCLDGEVEITTLTDDGPVQRTLRAGSVFVCPQGLWHRQFPRRAATILYGTATETSEVSFAEDPRS